MMNKQLDFWNNVMSVQDIFRDWSPSKRTSMAFARDSDSKGCDYLSKRAVKWSIYGWLQKIMEEAHLPDIDRPTLEDKVIAVIQRVVGCTKDDAVGILYVGLDKEQENIVDRLMREE